MNSENVTMETKNLFINNNVHGRFDKNRHIIFSATLILFYCPFAADNQKSDPVLRELGFCQCIPEQDDKKPPDLCGSHQPQIKLMYLIFTRYRCKTASTKSTTGKPGTINQNNKKQSTVGF